MIAPALPASAIQPPLNATQLHPIIRAHPETGRLGIFGCVGYIIAIDGMRDAEGAFDAGDSGTSGVTVKLYIDENNDGLVDAGDTLITPPPSFDQRGAPYVRIADGNGDGTARIDIGAFDGFTHDGPPQIDGRRVGQQAQPGLAHHRQHAVGLLDRAAKRNHDADIGEAHLVAELADRPAQGYTDGAGAAIENLTDLFVRHSLVEPQDHNRLLTW